MKMPKRENWRMFALVLILVLALLTVAGVHLWHVYHYNHEYAEGYIEGVVAYQNGALLNDCPHFWPGDKGQGWLAGWKAANKEYLEKNKK